MSRLTSTMLIAAVSALVIVLLADVQAGATDLQPMFQGYLAVVFHALGFVLVAATAALLALANQPSEALDA